VLVPIVHECATPDCETLTIGEFCLACEERRADDAPSLVDELTEAIQERRSEEG
jgi:hypothetical protein